MTHPRIIIGSLVLGVAINVAAIVTAHADIIIITNDHGGDYEKQIARVDNLRSTNERIIIDGWCGSGCTFLLNLPPGRVCATSRGRFGFHGARDAQFDLPNPRANEEMLRAYPPKVRAFVVRNYAQFLLGVVPARAQAFVPACLKRGER